MLPSRLVWFFISNLSADPRYVFQENPFHTLSRHGHRMLGRKYFLISRLSRWDTCICIWKIDKYTKVWHLWKVSSKKVLIPPQTYDFVCLEIPSAKSTLICMKWSAKNIFRFPDFLDDILAFVCKNWEVHQNMTFVKSVRQKSLNSTTDIRFRVRGNSFSQINTNMYEMVYKKYFSISRLSVWCTCICM